MMDKFEEQIELIQNHFENISDDELNKNLVDCGINEITYNYVYTMCVELLSNIEMNKFIEKVENYKEEKEWKMEKNLQVYAA